VPYCNPGRETVGVRLVVGWARPDIGCHAHALQRGHVLAGRFSTGNSQLTTTESANREPTVH
ncbi:MAG: hypothetical protein WDZ51_13830, partial [Pirellulaceae bacterium]